MLSGGDDYLFGVDSIPTPTLQKIEQAFGKAGLNGFAIETGRVKVPHSQRATYLAALADAKALPPTPVPKTAAPKTPEFRHAQEEELSLVIASMKGIERASVMIDTRKKPGFELTPRKTASITVLGNGGTSLDDDQIDRIRNYVAGAIPGIKPENVAILDANGRVGPGSDNSHKRPERTAAAPKMPAPQTPTYAPSTTPSYGASTTPSYGAGTTPSYGTITTPPLPLTTAAPDTAAPTMPEYVPYGTPAPKTPAPQTPSTPYRTHPGLPPSGTSGTPVPVPPTPITPAPMLSGLVPGASPMGFTMHFHMGGNFDASFDMNVTQGQAKEKASVAKKRKSDAAKNTDHSIPPMPPSTGSAVPPASSYYGSYSDPTPTARCYGSYGDRSPSGR